LRVLAREPFGVGASCAQGGRRVALRRATALSLMAVKHFDLLEIRIG
jgi:hypothetical protein